jgi:N-acetylneuraminic acid mutarotase
VSSLKRACSQIDVAVPEHVDLARSSLDRIACVFSNVSSVFVRGKVLIAINDNNLKEVQKMNKLLCTLAFFAVVVLCFPSAYAWIDTSSVIRWKTTTPLPVPIESHASVVNDNIVYVIGGQDSTILNTVYYAPIGFPGRIDSWLSTTSLPEGRAKPEAVVYNNFVYVLGGSAAVGIPQTERNTVWYAPINNDGTVGGWQSATSLPDPVTGHVAVTWNGYIYVAGGWTGYNWKNEVYYAKINPDGSLGSWVSTTPLPEPRGHGQAAVVYEGIIYEIGGEGPGSIVHNTVYYAKTNPDGTVGSWSLTTSLPLAIEEHSAVVLDKMLWVIGGYEQDGTAVDAVCYAKIKSDGTLGNWTQSTPLPNAIYQHSSVVLGQRIYVIGGHDASTTLNTVYYGRPIP